ncbi:MAG: RNA polymerase factor sigma-54 [Rhizobiaceae bacterium]
MALAQILALRQSQSLVMTPQLSQSIKLLTMSNIELASFIETELEKNPFLELEKSRNEREEMPAVTKAEADERNALDFGAQTKLDGGTLNEQLSPGIENTFPDDSAFQSDPRRKDHYEDRFETTSGGLTTSTTRSSDDVAVCELSPYRLTLGEHLQQQLALAAAPVKTHALAVHLIGLLDEAGYLHDDTFDIAERSGADIQDVETALHLVQTLEPLGVGARNLVECLTLQLADRERLDPAMQTVIDNLDLLAKRDFDTLRHLTGLDIEDLTDILTEIRSLEPRPGTLYSDAEIAHISPDVVVTETADGSWRVELNNETLPRVLVNNKYVTEVTEQIGDSKGREFVDGCLQNANWLTRSLDQRAQTILKVAREIVKRQDGFLVNGVRDLKPLTMQMVADEIDMHESSVSRVTTGKYMATPRGMFELKYFFTAAIASTGDGETHSSEAVRDRIRGLIDSETPKFVMSDDAIVSELEKSGISIARRTVAKYRNAMQIASSVQRRREKRAMDMAAREIA